MKQNEEKQYYDFLEKIIKEQKASSSFWDKRSSSYEMDILMLLNHIQKKKPELLYKIADNFVDTTSMKNCSKQDILSFMARTEKGTICKWKNESGEEIYLVNNGERFLKKSKQILVFGNELNKGDIELLKQSMYGQILKKDIQKVYDKIAYENRKKLMSKNNKNSKSFLESIIISREHKLEHNASDFEKNFKQLVKEQGSLCIPQATAQTMISFMPESEKIKLSKSLSLMGVRNSLELNHLLDRWKNEALNPNLEFNYKRSIKPRNVEVLRSR